MKQHETFIFDSYDFDPIGGSIALRYALDDKIHFTETLSLSRSCQLSAVSCQLDAALFALHLIGGVSYYKTCCPRRIEVRSGTLTEEQARFWNAVYEKGLGEFFFKNKIDFRGLVRFPNISDAIAPRPNPLPQGEGTTPKRILVPIGGGKDSIVTLELLRKECHDITLFRMNPHPLIDEIARVAGLPLLTIERRLSPMLFELNAQNALNGHVPITAYLSFLAVVLSLLYEFDAVAMSNERSASEGNVTYLGKLINHQWSKSEEFEQMFRAYVRMYITQAVELQNPLRTLSALEIAEAFAKYPRYFSCTTSCNGNWRIAQGGNAMEQQSAATSALWCGACPKCAFSFCLLAAFLPKDTVLGVFGKNLFEDHTLLPLYRELLGLKGSKPFECVGTSGETREAFQRTHERGEFESTLAMEMFLQELQLATVT